MSAKMKFDFCVDMPASIVSVEVDTEHFLAWANERWDLHADFTPADIADHLAASEFVEYLKAHKMTDQATVSGADHHWTECGEAWDLQESDEQ